MKHIRIIILSFCSIICNSMSFSQSVPFINKAADAGLLGMGDTGFAINTPFAVQRNAAAIMQHESSKRKVALSYLSGYPDFSNSYLVQLAGYNRMKNWGITGGIRYHGINDFAQIDEQGNLMDTFSPVEWVAELGFAYRINSSFSVGTTIRSVNSDLGGSDKASAIASDFSLLYEVEKFKWGVGYSNFGSKINYGNSKYSLPVRLNSGISYYYSYQNSHKLVGAFDWSYQFVPSYSGMIIGGGLEYSFNNLFFIRAGYHAENKFIGTSYATFGCGILLLDFKLDFAYMFPSSSNPIFNNMCLTLQWGI